MCLSTKKPHMKNPQLTLYSVVKVSSQIRRKSRMLTLAISVPEQLGKKRN